MCWRLLYRDQCSAAVQDRFPLRDTHHKFLRDVESEFASLWSELDRTTALDLHARTLGRIKHHLGAVKRQSDCLACLQAAPDKVMGCDHALCDDCVQAFGRSVPGRPHACTVERCPLCGQAASESGAKLFTFVPPTAGIRALSLDGGGVRGIVPLTFLRHLETQFAFLDCPLQEHFDLVVGTSSGESFFHACNTPADPELGCTPLTFCLRLRSALAPCPLSFAVPLGIPLHDRSIDADPPLQAA